MTTPSIPPGTSRPGQPRLLWHHRVHQLLGETCFYFLFSATHSRGHLLAGQLRERFARIGAKDLTVHITYGPIDVLIRVWLTEPRRQSFLRGLASASDELDIETVWEFGATNAIYAAIPHSPYASLREPSMLEDLREALRAVTYSATEESETAYHHILEAFLATSFTAEPGCKLYMFLNRDDSVGNVSRLRDVWEVLSSSGLRQLSLYEGEGFCDFVAKGIADSYAVSLEEIEKIQARLSQIGVTGWTLAPPNYGVESEGESLALVLNEPEDDLLDLISVGKNESEVDMLRGVLVDSEVREQIAALVAEAPPRGNWTSIDHEIEPRKQDRYYSILGSMLAKNKKEINRELSFLISLESDLRDVLKALRTRLGRASASPSRIEEAELDTLPAMLLNATDGEGELRERLIEYFNDSEWIETFPRIKALRDRYAHGRLLDAALDDNFDKKWWADLRTLQKAVRFQIAMELLKARLEMGAMP